MPKTRQQKQAERQARREANTDVPTPHNPFAGMTREQKAAAGNINARARLLARDPGVVQRAWGYYSALDDSNKHAFLNSNPHLENAFVYRGLLSHAEIERLFAGSQYQTLDGKPLDPLAVQPVFGV